MVNMKNTSEVHAYRYNYLYNLNQNQFMYRNECINFGSHLVNIIIQNIGNTIKQSLSTERFGILKVMHSLVLDRNSCRM